MGFWDAWKAARKCDFFFCQTRLQSGDKFVISLRAHILRDAARTPSTGPACCGAHRFFGCVSKVGRVDSLRETEGRPWTGVCVQGGRVDSLRGAQGRPWTGGCKKTQRGRIGGVSKVGGWILLGEHRGDLGHRVGEGGVRVGEGGWVCPPPRHTLSRRLPSATHAVRCIARGAWAPARRVDAPLRCGVPQGPHHLVRWCGGVVRRGVSVGAEQARARTPFASPAGDSAIRRPRRSGCARLCALRARTARIRLRDGRGCWWRVSTQSASPHRSPVGRGRGRGCRITRLGRMERVLSSCTLCDAVERRVGRVRGQKQRAQPYTRGTRGRVGGGS